MGGNGRHSSGSGRDGIFPQFFVGLGRDEINFVGVGRERFENSLPCHPLIPTTLPEQSKAVHLLHGRSKNVSVSKAYAQFR